MRGMIAYAFATALAVNAASDSGADEPPPQGARPITIDVDASEVARRIIHARLDIPAQPGPLTLLYPKWIPGEHGPTGPITDLAGLRITSGGKAIPWRRDEADMYAFGCEVPEGADAVEVRLDFLLTPPSTQGFSSASSASARLAVLSWNQLLLYPKGRPARDITCRARLRLPDGWKYGTALRTESHSADRAEFAPASLETLIDSPVLCGEHLREVTLGPPGGTPHLLTIASDSVEGLELPPETKSRYDRLVAEAGALFGNRPYGSYRFLLALSDHVAHFGLEHHESSDNRVPERSLIDADLRTLHAPLLPHEFVHAWNGKYRRPADMVTDDYQRPRRTRLLWVYEGLTNYLGVVLAARCGLLDEGQFRDLLAITAEGQRNQRGRSWRPLSDTAVAAQLLFDARPDRATWRRGVDFYAEGILLWLEVDTILRERTRGEKSLDDFCRRFHGGQDGSPAVKTYDLDDVVAALDETAPFEWEAFLSGRVEEVSEQAPLEGVRKGGWRLTYADQPSGLQRGMEGVAKTVDLTPSIGVSLGQDGAVIDVVPDGAADRAGVGPGMKLIAVNSRRYSPQVLRAAVAASKSSKDDLDLLVENGEFYRTCRLDYHGGEKYPRLERDPSRADLLTAILKSLTPKEAESGADSK